MAEGRLTQPEFDERLDVAMKAKTAGELEPLFRDLPGPNPSRPAELARLPEPTRPRGQRRDGPVARPSRRSRRRWIRSGSPPCRSRSPSLWMLDGVRIRLRSTCRHWMIFILPIVLSIVLGKLKGTRSTDRARRPLGDHRARADRLRRGQGLSPCPGRLGAGRGQPVDRSGASASRQRTASSGRTGRTRRSSRIPTSTCSTSPRRIRSITGLPWPGSRRARPCWSRRRSRRRSPGPRR